MKKVYIILYKTIFNFIYAGITLFEKSNENKAVFVLSRENKLQGNLQFVFNELKKLKPDIEIHFIYAENKMNLKLFKELFIIKNAKYLILDDYYLPVYLIKPKKKMKIIQLWHATGAFKKFGYSTVGTKFGPSEQYLSMVPIHSNYTHVYVSSPNVVKFYAEAFNMSSENIYPLGVPRTDMFFDEKYHELIEEELLEKHQFINNNEKVNILIAPTYRATGFQGESTLNIAEIITHISSKLNDKIQILYRAHPYTTKKEIENLKKCPNVFLINDYTLNEWMFVSDAFITDYSSAVFEFALLQKPFAHFVPDIDEYEKNRGFYETMNKITIGTIIKDEKTLINWINHRYKNEGFNTKKMNEYHFGKMKNISSGVVSHFINK